MDPTSLEGLVLRIDAKVCHLEILGQRRTLPLSGKLFEARSHEKRPLAVGDRVRLDVTGNSIDAVLPRQSQLHRRAASEGEERAQVVAANITLVVAVTSIAEPPFQPELVDGILAAAARERIPAVLVLTKIDRDTKGMAAHWRAVYEAISVRVFATSTAAGHATTAEFVALGELLHQNRSVLCGLSGVGKSTLLNTVLPGLDLRTGALNHIRQGKHTTTATELIALPGGGHVLDTPGVRSFHLFHAGAQELQFLFPEIAQRLPQCGYRNCLHRDEPDCAVRAAAAQGAIAATRMASYSTMVEAAMRKDRQHSRLDEGDDEPRPSGGRRRRP